jgi:hypothetical protein
VDLAELILLNSLICSAKIHPRPGFCRTLLQNMATQHFYPETENEYYKCLLCKDAIYNPLCHCCLGKQVETWLGRYPALEKNLKKKIQNFIKKIDDETNEALNCVSCHSKKASICPYCFAEYVLGQLKKAKASMPILNEFIKFFDYDYDLTGYVQEHVDYK